MTKEIKTIIALVVLIAVVIIGWLWYGSSNNAQAPAGQKQVSSSRQQVYVPADAGLTTSPSDTSDAALQSDMGSVNAQMKSLNTDTSNISN
ncbi:MAG: hypothetical protein PHG25_00155 [Candidatus Pacebacteria bacterium]|nr:hypothetical protein [Candidatus Paceibacterota bacterium]